MKTNGTRILIIAIFLYLFIVLLSFSSMAQPDYIFKGAVLLSGTDKQIGARYRFPAVKPGVDAIVTITNLTGGLTLDNIDGPSGFDEAFQPVIMVPGSSTGYAEFKIDFVVAGGFVPAVMLEVPVTPIDVDGQTYGGLPLYEFDMVALSPSNYVDYNMLGGELLVNFSPGWVTGTNTAAIDYPGVDTMAKQVMLTTVLSNVTTATVRVGAINNSTGTQLRLRSIYFKKFTYANSFLAKSCLVWFKGNQKNNFTALQWQLNCQGKVASVIVEKSYTSADFKPIGELAVGSGVLGNANYQYTDNSLASGTTYYRLKVIMTSGLVEYSNILVFRNADATSGAFKIFPSTVQSNATVQVMSIQPGTGTLQVVDYSGRIVQQQMITVQEGNNSIVLTNLGNLPRSSYVVVLRLNDKVYNQKILKQ